jgi:hypothetical protein
MSLLFCLALICFQHTSRVNAVDDGSSLSRISALSTSQLITTFAGTGQGDFNGDGILANTATIYKPAGVTFDSSGNMHIAESGGQRIRKIDAITGIISTVAGTGTRGKSLDNIAAVTAVLSTPSALAFDTLGNLFFAEENNHRVRKIDAITGIITTIAGTGDYGYYTKENVPAIGESLYSPRGLLTCSETCTSPIHRTVVSEKSILRQGSCRLSLAMVIQDSVVKVLTQRRQG